MQKKSMRAVIFQEEGAWLAHCLERDICAQGATIGEAHERLKMTIAAERDYSRERGVLDFDGIEPAPVRISALYSEARETYQPHSSTPGLSVRVALSER